MDERDFLTTIDLLTDRPPLEARLKRMLDAARAFFNLDVCSLLFVPDSGADFHIVSCGMGAGAVHEERGQYFCADRAVDAGDEIVVLRRGQGEGAGIFTHNFRVESVAGADFRPLRNLEVRLRLTRSQPHGEFSDGEVDIIERLIAAIRSAIRAATREAHDALFNRYAQKLLTCLRVGIFVVSPRLEILGQSSLADELLARLRSYRRNEGRLAGADDEQQQKLEQALLDLTASSDAPYKVVDIIATGRGEQYPLVLARTTLAPPAFVENCYAVLIFSSAEDLCNVDRLLNLWQISPAEKRVLTAIARYENIKKVALELNISPNTAKAQLKSVYKKLGVGSKMRLMKRLNVLRNVEALMS